MKTYIISAHVELPLPKARLIVTSANALDSFRVYCEQVHHILPDSITNTDISTLRDKVAMALGQEELARLTETGLAEAV